MAAETERSYGECKRRWFIPSLPAPLPCSRRRQLRPIASGTAEAQETQARASSSRTSLLPKGYSRMALTSTRGFSISLVGNQRAPRSPRHHLRAWVEALGPHRMKVSHDFEPRSGYWGSFFCPTQGCSSLVSLRGERRRSERSANANGPAILPVTRCQPDPQPTMGSVPRQPDRGGPRRERGDAFDRPTRCKPYRGLAERPAPAPPLRTCNCRAWSCRTSDRSGSDRPCWRY